MKTVAFTEVEDWESVYLKKELSVHKLLFLSDELASRNVSKVSQAEIISPFIYSTIDKNLLDSLPLLRMITTRSTGFDHIDLAACKKRNITVCNVPYYGENTVAEHTFALILSLSRKIPQSIERTRRGDFSLTGLRGVDLMGKTLGVVGTGHIGRQVIGIAKGFKMSVLAFDIKPDKEFARKLAFKYVELDELLANSDIISLHVPLNDNTHHLVNKENITVIKKGAYLINTARGGVVETEALITALEDGKLAGVGLDVLEEECFIKEERQLLSKVFLKECDIKTALQNHILLEQENVLITPHNAFNSNEALLRILDTTVSNILSFLGGKSENVVTQK